MINEYDSSTPATPGDFASSTSIDNDSVISTLNGLIETCKDGQNGFKEAAEGVERSDLKSLFYEFSQQRSQFAGELQTLVQGLGGDPENSGSTLAALHRGWINIKSVVTGKDEKAILNECERGEDSAKECLQKCTRRNAAFECDGNDSDPIYFGSGRSRWDKGASRFVRRGQHVGEHGIGKQLIPFLLRTLV